MSSFNSSTPNFDNLLLQSLMGRLQIRPPPPANNRQDQDNPLHSLSFEDFLLDAATNYRFSDSDSGDDDAGEFPAGKSQLAKEEAKLEKELIKIILAGKTETLKPNSGQAISIGEHHICVGFHEETGSDYRVWEWHGHIMLFDDENGYTPEYIYGNYFERLVVGKGSVSGVKKETLVEEEVEEREEKTENLGLRELIETGDSTASRILHRSVNAGSSRF